MVWWWGRGDRGGAKQENLIRIASIEIHERHRKTAAQNLTCSQNWLAQGLPINNINYMATDKNDIVGSPGGINYISMEIRNPGARVPQRKLFITVGDIKGKQ